MKIEHIIKRDFTTTVYDLNKIIDAIEKAMSAVGVGNRQNADDVASLVNQKLLERKKQSLNIFQRLNRFKIQLRPN